MIAYFEEKGRVAHFSCHESRLRQKAPAYFGHVEAFEVGVKASDSRLGEVEDVTSFHLNYTKKKSW